MGTSNTSPHLRAAHSRARNPKRPKRDIAAEVKEMELALSSVKMGRPSKLTEAIVEKLKQAFAIDATVEEACFYAGINKTTYYNWKKDHTDLFNDLETLRITPILAARQTIAAASKNDVNTAKWILERKRRKEYATNLDITSDGKALPQPILAMLTTQNAENSRKVITNDVIDGEESEESSTKPQIATPENSGNIMDDINQ